MIATTLCNCHGLSKAHRDKLKVVRLDISGGGTRMVATKKAPGVRSIQILPQNPNMAEGNRESTASNNVSAAKLDTFFEAFGPIGILLLLSAGISVCWTVWLTILTIAPNDTANYLMDTAEFDDGHFWLIIDPEPEIMSVSAILLVALAVSYIHVILKMTALRNSSFRVRPEGPKKAEVFPIWVERLPYIGKNLLQAVSFWLELTGYYGVYRKFWVSF
ncbi:unnamed protein product [Phytophthora fragariaefolia]|uniref:Unnamed protein product n=1 Tax=Phytophthora fragariaefolia TaxID=1490495 RepID=A0A9W6WR33_9STRA|nr:unnamed protein product [Phytophthora fragariaefolia]